MDTKVALPLPVPPLDFNFDSTSSSPYITAPSSPTRFGNNNYFFSAPTSPTRASAFYRHLSVDFDSTLPTQYSPSTVPFKWEDKPGIPKSRATINGHDHHDDDQDFEFDFSGQMERASLPADELFDGGKIRPLKPPPRLQVVTGSARYDLGPSSLSPRSPSPRSSSRISQGKKMVQEVLSASSSPRQYKSHTNNFDPFTAAMEETTSEDQSDQQRRGRERIMPPRNASVRRGISRSLSPLRVSDSTFHLDDVVSPSTTTRSTNSNNNNNNNNNSNSNSVSKPSTSSSSAYSAILSAISFSKGSNRKWKLRDLLLFRSASEGRATTTGKDPLRKYTMLSMNKKSGIGGGGGGSSSIAHEDVKNSSFRSTDSVGSVSSRRRGPVSPHELHYTVNRAVSEEMKRKTFLPYKHGLLGCLGFNNGLHEISRGAFGFTRG